MTQRSTKSREAVDGPAMTASKATNKRSRSPRRKRQIDRGKPPMVIYKEQVQRQQLTIRRMVIAGDALGATAGGLLQAFRDPGLVRLLRRTGLEAAPEFLCRTVEDAGGLVRDRPTNRPPYRLIPLGAIECEPELASPARSDPGYSRLAESIKRHGVVQPLIVRPDTTKPDRYVLMDGRIRYDILLAMKASTVECLVSFNGEPYTSTHATGRLCAIQQHHMFQRAMKRGLGLEAIAEVIGMTRKNIYRKTQLLARISDPAAALLDCERAPFSTYDALRLVGPARQQRIAELLVATRNFSGPYTACLLAATPAEQWADTGGAATDPRLTAADVDRLRREREPMESRFLNAHRQLGAVSLRLVVAQGYLHRLLSEHEVLAFLHREFPGQLETFQRILTIGEPGSQAIEGAA